MTGSPRPLFLPCVAAFAAWLTTFSLLAIATAFLDATRPGRADASPIVRGGALLAPNTPNARRAGDAMVIANRPGAALTILAIGAGPMAANDYAHLMIDAEPLPQGLEVALIWVNRDQPGQPHEMTLETDHGRLVPAALDRNPGWRGDITFLGIGVKGVVDPPWAIREVRLEPPGMVATLVDMRRDWNAFEPWNGRSINVVFGGREDQRLWLPPAVFVASLVAAFVLSAVARRRGVAVSVLGLAMPFLLGWIVIDMRWQRNLVEQAKGTWAQFAGRSWEERHLQTVDAELFRFIEAARAKMPQHPVRVFATSDFEYFRRRAGYHLYPHNVLAYHWSDPAVLRPGDFVFFYRKNDVHYDARNRTLVWKDGKRLPANIVLAQRGAGMFEVRESVP